MLSEVKVKDVRWPTRVIRVVTVLLCGTIGIGVNTQIAIAKSSDFELKIVKLLEKQNVATPRIVNGSTIDIAKAPFAVGIFTKGFCSGTVIDPLHILTAAHCIRTRDNKSYVAPEAVTIAAGAAKQNSVTALKAAQKIKAAALYPHPRFDGKGFLNDLAVIKLSTPLTLQPGVVEALPLETANKLILPGDRATIVGMGLTSAKSTSSWGVLRRVKATTLTGRHCGVNAPALVVCTYGGKSGESGACSGDSGGALVKGNRLIGVTNYVTSLSCRNGVDGFANVTQPENRDFIQSALADAPLTAKQIKVSPRGGLAATISRYPVSGKSVKCARGNWRGSKISFKYKFVRFKGNSQYETTWLTKSRVRLPKSSRGWRVACLIKVKNAGGEGVSISSNYPPLIR